MGALDFSFESARALRGGAKRDFTPSHVSEAAGTCAGLNHSVWERRDKRMLRYIRYHTLTGYYGSVDANTRHRPCLATPPRRGQVPSLLLVLPAHMRARPCAESRDLGGRSGGQCMYSSPAYCAEPPCACPHPPASPSASTPGAANCSPLKTKSRRSSATRFAEHGLHLRSTDKRTQPQPTVSGS